MSNLSKWAALALTAATEVSAWPNVGIPGGEESSGSLAVIVTCVVAGCVAAAALVGTLIWSRCGQSSNNNNTNDQNDKAMPLHNMNNTV